MDTFFSKTRCDKCRKNLEAGRTMSRFDQSCLCLDCAEREKQDPEYEKVVQAERNEIRLGNYNFPGIRHKK